MSQSLWLLHAEYENNNSNWLFSKYRILFYSHKYANFQTTLKNKKARGMREVILMKLSWKATAPGMLLNNMISYILLCAVSLSNNMYAIGPKLICT